MKEMKEITLLNVPLRNSSRSSLYGINDLENFLAV